MINSSIDVCKGINAGADMPTIANHPGTGFSNATEVESDIQLFKTSSPFNLLLALESDNEASTIIRFASALVARGARPSVFRALEVMAPPLGSDDAIVLYEHAILGKDLHIAAERSLRELIEKTLGHKTDWPIKSVGGDPAQCILEEAEVVNARAIVMGLHTHGTFSQAIGENTASRVMSKAVIPVFGVRQSLPPAPRKIMVAVDFGFASRKAAHIAANLADPGGTVVLVHCAPTEWIVEEGDEGAALVQREGVEHAFEHLVHEISAGKKITVETIKRNGDPHTQLIAVADSISPDLLTVASHRHHVTTRLLIGSVARQLIRDGKWSLLVIPPTDRATYRKLLHENGMKG
jgi:nucleotide-binding universal stress UspA family protein